MKTEPELVLPQDPADREDPPVAPTPWLERSAGWIVGGAAVVAAAWLMYVARHSSFFFDEWWFVVRRRDASLDDFFRPWNGHLIAIPVLIYNAMFRIIGMRSYVPYRALLVALHLLTCGLLFVYLRRRGAIVYALAATIVMLFLGFAWEDLIWAFQITFVISLAAGIGALLLLDRHDRAGNVGAMLALGASIASSGLGLIFAGGLVIELLWQRRDRRRIWIVLAPLAFYAVWYVLDSNSSGTVNNFDHFDGFTTTLVGNATRAILGVPLGAGQVLLVAFYVVAVVQAVRTWPVSGRFVGTLAMPIAFWALVTYSRGEFPVGTRYAHPGAVFLVLAGAEVLRTMRLPRSLPRAVVVAASVALVVVVAHTLVVNLDALNDGAATLKTFSEVDRTRLSAMAVAADRVDPHAGAFRIVNPLRAGRVLKAMRELDYPIMSPQEILRQPEYARRTADGTLWDTLGGADTTPHQLAVANAGLAVSPVASTVDDDGACSAVTPGAPGAHVTVEADELAVRIEAGDSPVDVRARSVAHGFNPIRMWTLPPAITLAPGATRDLVVRATGIRPWVLRLQSDTPYRVCALR